MNNSNKYILITGSLYLVEKLEKIIYKFELSQDSSIFFGKLPTLVSTRFPFLNKH